MLNSLMNAVLHPIVALWGLASSSTWSKLPRPTETTTQAAGPDADRLLLIGSGIAVGYGTSSHEVSLAGHLARRLAEATGRGVFMDIETSPQLLLKDTAQILAGQELTRFDAIILAFGGYEVATLQSSTVWRHDLDAVLALIESGTAHNDVFVVGIPLIDGLPPVYGGVVRRRVAQLNMQSKHACASHFAATYVEVATSTEVERVRASARNLFGVDIAAVNIIDRDLQRVQAIVGAPGRTIARQDSVCDFTIRTADLMVVEDLRDDTRFSEKYGARTEPGVLGLRWGAAARARPACTGSHASTALTLPGVREQPGSGRD